MNNNFKNIKPKWLVKRKKLKMPSGNVVTFGGEKDDLIIVTKEGSKVHATFTLRPDEFLLEKTERSKNYEHSREYFRLDKNLIMDLTNHWMKKNSHQIIIVETKSWLSRKEMVVDINDEKFPETIELQDLYNVKPETLKKFALSKERVIRLKFSMGAFYDSNGNCQGLLIPFKKQNKLIIVERKFLDLILDTALGIDWLKRSLNEDERSAYL